MEQPENPNQPENQSTTPRKRRRIPYQPVHLPLSSDLYKNEEPELENPSEDILPFEDLDAIEPEVEVWDTDHALDNTDPDSDGDIQDDTSEEEEDPDSEDAEDFSGLFEEEELG
jgi:hypothetical protein